MEWLREYQSLAGMVIGLVGCYKFMYQPTMRLIEQNEKRIENLENRCFKD